MINTGSVDRLRQPRIKLTVKGNRKSININPAIDTGFNGYLSLPVAIAIPLGLELKGEVPVELADGSLKKELTFRGAVNWQGLEYDIDIFLTESVDALLGSGLLQGLKLTIGYANRFVTIEQDIVPKSNKQKKRKSAK
jgi:clan AA aspartic protease